MVLETDKAAMEIPASVDGIVKNINMAKTGMPFVDIEMQKKPIKTVNGHFSMNIEIS